MYSAIAQLVEQATVNRWVVGSSPTRGAILASKATQRAGRFAGPFVLRSDWTIPALAGMDSGRMEA